MTKDALPLWVIIRANAVIVDPPFSKWDVVLGFTVESFKLCLDHFVSKCVVVLKNRILVAVVNLTIHLGKQKIIVSLTGWEIVWWALYGFLASYEKNVLVGAIYVHIWI